jgi:hypothetical protein
MVQEDLGGFGDARLRRVGARLLGAMGQRPATCIHALTKDRNEALCFGRFLDHSSVSYGEMLTATGRFTGRGAAGWRMLAIQDTSEFNFPGHVARKSGFGRSGNDRDLGLFLHPIIAVDAVRGGMIGLVGARVLNRTGDKIDASKPRAIEDKESYRWLHAAERPLMCWLGRRASPWSLTVRATSTSSSPVVRPVCSCSRAPPKIAPLRKSVGYLRRSMRGPSSIARRSYLPAQPGRGEREACVALRFGRVSLRRPTTEDIQLAASVDLSVVRDSLWVSRRGGQISTSRRGPRFPASTIRPGKVQLSGEAEWLEAKGGQAIPTQLGYGSRLSAERGAQPPMKPSRRALRVIRLHGGRLQCSEHLLNGPHCPCCGGDGVVSSQHAQQRRHFDDAFGRYHAEFRRMATQGMRITIS